MGPCHYQYLLLGEKGSVATSCRNTEYSIFTNHFNEHIWNDRTIMSPFCKSAKMAAPPLNKFPCSKTAPSLPETTVPVLTSYPPPSIKATARPGSGLRHLFPGQPGSLGLPLNFALWTWVFSWAFFESSVFPNIEYLLNTNTRPHLWGAFERTNEQIFKMSTRHKNLSQNWWKYCPSSSLFQLYDI
jgi:hypothetical protein